MTAADPATAPAEVLAANEAFYRAFSHGDLLGMAKLWATQSSVTCAHPGMQVLRGRDAVMKSWSALLRVRPEVPLHCFAPRVQLLGSLAVGGVAVVVAAVVTCYEGAGDGPAHLAATNVFVWEVGAWKMVHHHAGPLQRPVALQPQVSSLN